MASEIPPARSLRGEHDAGVGGGVLPQPLDDLRSGGAVVDQAELPVPEALSADGLDCLAEHLKRRVVDGHQHRHERLGVASRRSRIARRRGGECSVRLGGGVDEHRIHPGHPGDQPGTALARRVDDEPQLGRTRGHDAAHDRPLALAAGRSGGDLCGPGGAHAPLYRHDLDAGTDREGAPEPVVGEQLNPRVQLERPGDDEAEAHRGVLALHQTATERAVGVDRPVGAARAVVEPHPQSGERDPVAGAPRSRRGGRWCGDQRGGESGGGLDRGRRLTVLA